MRVLMLGWEYPPYYSGGLGIACYGITKGLAHQGVEVTYVMPSPPDTGKILEKKEEFAKIIFADFNALRDKVKFISFESIITPYSTFTSYKEKYMHFGKYGKVNFQYGKNLYEEVVRFAEFVKQLILTRHESFDVIHAHDWLTFKAGIVAKEVTGKPLVVHVHATEYDRTGGLSFNPIVYDIEKEGMEKADKVITVSNYTKNIVVKYYGIDPNKIEVVHNSIDLKNVDIEPIKPFEKIVLFLGRLTLQKGPDYFIKAAKKVLEHDPNVKFVIAGSGDMETFVMEEAARLGISRNIIFTGFLRGLDVYKAYRMADVYVMPSVSEPFGLTVLEALGNETPVIVSKQSGVSEQVKHVLKVDFWDIDKMANYILAVLNYKTLANELKKHGKLEVKRYTWFDAAAKIKKVYEEVVAK